MKDIKAIIVHSHYTKHHIETLSVATIISVFQHRPEVATAVSKGKKKLTKKPCNCVLRRSVTGSLGCYFRFISCADLIKPQSLLETVPVVGMSEADPFVLCINQNHNVKVPFESSYIKSNLDTTCLNIHV